MLYKKIYFNKKLKIKSMIKILQENIESENEILRKDCELVKQKNHDVSSHEICDDGRSVREFSWSMSLKKSLIHW